MAVSLYGSGQTILQVQSSVLSTLASFAPNSGVYQASGLSVSITPFSTSSKILISGFIQVSSQNNLNIYLHLYKNGSQITPNGTATGQTPSNCYINFGTGVAGNAGGSVPMHFTFVDSPSTTSACTYAVYVAANSAGVVNLEINPTTSGGGGSPGGNSFICVQEISGA